MNNSPTKTRTALRMIGTATAHLITKNGASTLFTVLGLIAPFMHLLAGSSQEGVFGWAYMSSFLNAVGWALLPFFLGISLLLEADSKKEFKVAYKLRSCAIIAIGVFYLIYTVIPMQDFTDLQYYTMISLLAILGTVFVYFTSKAITNTEQALKATIRNLFRYILITIPNKYISTTDLPQYDRDAVNLTKKVSNEY